MRKAAAWAGEAIKMIGALPAMEPTPVMPAAPAISCWTSAYNDSLFTVSADGVRPEMPLSSPAGRTPSLATASNFSIGYQTNRIIESRLDRGFDVRKAVLKDFPGDYADGGGFARR
jgi:hypothetical protein